ncbi:5-hydroxytryptamine receptor 3A-like [Engraulis encrasicolus]|uniref:5-hydroxytryptamine receptor 3A-like n=1 Tax=Engraulis encrasicolus TaxID=184585 RepID=UPI002FD21B8F
MAAHRDKDEKAQLLETMIWFTMSWKNQFLSWDPEQCGTSSMTLPRTMLWVPDVVIDEFVDENNAPETFYAHVTHDGYIKDEMPLEVISSCNLEIFRFPFDTQNCSYTFQSWIHNSHEIKLRLGHTVGEIMNTSRDVMVTKGEWELLDMTVYEHELDIGVAARHQITYYIVLRRQSTMYVVNLIIPSFFLITVDLFSFVLPPQNIDRSAFKMTLILGYTVFLLLMNELLPVTGNTIPLINVFFSMCLALMVGSLLETILITNMMCGSIRDLPMPNWFRVFFLKFLAPLVFMKKRVKKRTSTQSQASGGEVAHVSGKGEGQLGSRDGQTADPSVVELQHLGEELQAIQRHLQKKPVTVDQNAEDWIFTWQMESLSWDVAECGTSSITLPRNMLWAQIVTQASLLYSVDENNAPETFYLYVSHTGEVMDMMPVEVVSSCTLDIYEFPFDSQNCSYTFRSWIHNGEERRPPFIGTRLMK